MTHIFKTQNIELEAINMLGKIRCQVFPLADKNTFEEMKFIANNITDIVEELSKNTLISHIDVIDIKSQLISDGGFKVK